MGNIKDIFSHQISNREAVWTMQTIIGEKWLNGAHSYAHSTINSCLICTNWRHITATTTRSSFLVYRLSFWTYRMFFFIFHIIFRLNKNRPNAMIQTRRVIQRVRAIRVQRGCTCTGGSDSWRRVLVIHRFSRFEDASYAVSFEEIAC